MVLQDKLEVDVQHSKSPFEEQERGLFLEERFRQKTQRCD